MAGSQWAPREVHFAHQAPNETWAHLAYFQAPAIFRCAANAFVMDCAFPAADQISQDLSRCLDDVLSRMPKEDKDLRLVRKNGRSVNKR